MSTWSAASHKVIVNACQASECSRQEEDGHPSNDSPRHQQHTRCGRGIGFLYTRRGEHERCFAMLLGASSPVDPRMRDRGSSREFQAAEGSSGDTICRIHSMIYQWLLVRASRRRCELSQKIAALSSSPRMDSSRSEEARKAQYGHSRLVSALPTTKLSSDVSLVSVSTNGCFRPGDRDFKRANARRKRRVWIAPCVLKFQLLVAHTNVNG